MLKRIIYLVIIFNCFTFLNAQKLSLEISLEKEKYLSGEPVILIGKLKNISSQKIDIYTFMPVYRCNTVKISVKSSTAEILPQTREHAIIDLFEPNPKILEPGEIYYQRFDISNWFGNSNSGNGTFLNFSEFLPGTYSSFIIFTHDSIAYQSNEVKFEVTKPTNPVHIEIHAKLKTAVYHLLRFSGDHPEELQIFKDHIIALISDYPANPYSYLIYSNFIMAYFEIQRSLGKFDQVEFNSYYIQMIDQSLNNMFGFIIAQEYFYSYKGTSKNDIVRKMQQSPFSYLYKEFFIEREKEQK